LLFKSNIQNELQLLVGVGTDSLRKNPSVAVEVIGALGGRLRETNENLSEYFSR
jgi:hypothetical protein